MLPDRSSCLDELGGALWRELYGRNPQLSVDHVHRLALYACREVGMLRALPREDFYAGNIPWGAPPDWAGVVDDEGRTTRTHDTKEDYGKARGEVEALGGVPFEDDETLPEGWKSTLSAGGKVYYWNQKSKETRWDKPT